MYSIPRSLTARLGLSHLRNLAGLVIRKPYSCLCVTYDFRGTCLPNFHQKLRGPVCQDVNCFAHHSIKPFSTEIKSKILVYHGNLTPQIRMVKIFSLCSSIAGLAAQPLLYNHASEFGGTGVIIGVATFVGFFTFVTPLLLHILTRKYVTDIHYDGATGIYTATLLTFFLRMKKVSFKSEDVVVPDVPALFTSFVVKNTALFIDPCQFEDPVYYGKLMGYDKPMDFHLKKEPQKDTDTDKSQ